MARHDFILDTTLTQDRSISGVFAGNPVEAHASGVEFLINTSLERLSALADAVVTSSAGYPLDLTFYQAVKGITAARHLARTGGRILLLAECSEGVGSPRYAKMLETLAGCREFLDSISSTPVEIDQWQLERLALTGLNNDLYFYTPGMRPDEAGCFGSRCFPSADQAVAATLAGLPAGAHVALIPEGPYTYARAVNGSH
jgi:hypothetical protein